MAISRRLRFEILKRDGHRCRYCGAGPDDGPLTVDHVIPTALGGTDDPSNLCCACRSCNSGKSAVHPDAEHVAQVAADAGRWAEAMKRAAAMRGAQRKAEDAYVEAFDEMWTDWYTRRRGPGRQWTDEDRIAVDRPGWWEKSVRGLYQRGVPIDLVEYAIGIAMRKIGTERPFDYMLGVCRGEGDRMSDLARMILDGREVEAAARMDPTIEYLNHAHGKRDLARAVKAYNVLVEQRELLRKTTTGPPPLSPERLTPLTWTPDPEYWRSRGEDENVPAAQWRAGDDPNGLTVLVEYGAVGVAEVAKLLEGGQLTVGGALTEVDQSIDENGRQRARAWLTDETGTARVYFFPGLYEIVRNDVVDWQVVLVKGFVNDNGDEGNVLIATDVAVPDLEDLAAMRSRDADVAT